MIRLARSAVLFLRFASAGAEAQGPEVQVPVQVTAEEFLQMSAERQILYFYGVLDTLAALVTDKLIPEKAAACSRINYGELISEVKSDLYKALGSEKSAVRNHKPYTCLDLDSSPVLGELRGA